MKKQAQRNTLSQMRPIVLGYSNYAGTKKAYCAKHALNPHTLDYWRKRIEQIDKAAVAGTPKSVVGKTSNQNKFIRVPQLSQAGYDIKAGHYYILELPDGKSLHLPLSTSVAVLTELLQTPVLCLP